MRRKVKSITQNSTLIYGHMVVPHILCLGICVWEMGTVERESMVVRKNIKQRDRVTQENSQTLQMHS